MENQVRFMIIPLVMFITLAGYQNQYQQKEKTETSFFVLPKVGEKIEGDFNGDGKRDIAVVIKTKEGKGNPIEDGTPDEYAVRFSDKSFKSINAGCCSIRLINEGDLNNDGRDEISLFQAPMNGCTYSMVTYSFKDGAWQQIVGPFLIPTGCEDISDNDLQKRIVKENNKIYYYETDPNDDEGKLIKKLNKLTPAKRKI